MYFCPNCDNVFDITKTAKQQSGGKDIYEDVVDKLSRGEELAEEELKKVNIEDFTKSVFYKKLKPKQKELLYNKLNDLLPDDKKVMPDEKDEKVPKIFFICSNCGYMKPIEPGTVIFSRVSDDVSQSYSVSDVGPMRHSDILPLTRKYVCPNTGCESHKDPLKREAKFFRKNNSHNIQYICTACDTAF